ncbi:hypothetical protein ABBQ38_005829 [Trebouxia sp. C0009 RCD-2024]
MSWYVNGYVYRPQRALKHRAGEVGPVISDDAKADVSWMQSTLQRALDGTHLSAPEKDHFQQRMHFATDPVPDSSTWIPRLLEEWTTSRKVITVSTQPGRLRNLTTERLDSAYGWLPWPDTLPSAQLSLLEDPCTPLNVSADGRVLLALLPDECSAAEIVRNAQDAGAAAVIFAAPEGHDVFPISCKEEECAWPLSTPATMISHDAGAMLLSALWAVGERPGYQLEVRVEEQQVPGYYAGIDEQGRLIEMGWMKWPSLMHLAWQGQWQNYLHNLHANLSKPALTVPIFVNQVTVNILLHNQASEVE